MRPGESEHRDQQDRIVVKSNSGNAQQEILIVDDSATSLTWATAVLQRAGYRVRQATDGLEALQAMAAQPPDLILLDILLPDVDGFEITRRMKQDVTLSSIPIILLTTLADVENRVKGLRLGASDFLTKPPEEDELLARVELHLRLRRNQEELQAEKAKIELLYRISRELSAELDLDTLLSRILELTIDSIAATAGSIVLLNEQGGALRHISSRRETGAKITQSVWDQVLQDGLAGWVIRNREAANLHDTRQDPRWVTIEGAYSETRSALAVPLLHENRAIGVLTLTHEEPARFTATHLDLLGSIASQGAIVAEKARFYQMEQFQSRQLRLVNRVGHQVTSILDPKQLLQEVARLICETFDYYYVEVGLCEGEELVFQGWGSGKQAELHSPPARLPLSEQGIVTWVAREGKPLLVPDVRQEPRYRPVPEIPDTFAELAVPLQVGGRVLGVIEVQSDRRGQLTEKEIPLLETLASQIAVALNNAHLFQERDRRITELAILNQISRVLSSALDLNELLETIYQQVGRLFDTNNFYIAAYYPESDEWETLLEIEEGERLLPERYKVGAGLTGYIIRHKAPLLFRNVAQVEEFSRKEGVDPIGRMARSWLGVPLLTADKIVGVMAIQSFEQKNLYGDEDLALFSTIATQAAGAIENARLYTETEQERGKLAAVLAGTADAVIVTDSEGTILLFNPAAERAFGLQVDQVIGKPLENAMPNSVLRDLFRRSMEQRPRHADEIPLSDERTLYASVSRVGEVGHVAVMQDITHLKKLDKMKSEFVSTVSHDLRNPLSSIHGYADVLAESIDEEYREYAQRIKLVAKQMAELIEDLLNLGKIEAGIEMEHVPCDLQQLVQEAMEEASFQAQLHEVSLESLVFSPLGLVLGDPRRLRQVLDNLIGNALKYTPAGKSILVRTWEEQGQVMVEVRDTGIGIPREALPRLFEKFYRVRSPEIDRIPGTGLGLAIAKAIVEQHGGRVWVDSELGQGSVFGFSLPATEKGGRAPSSDPREKPI